MEMYEIKLSISQRFLVNVITILPNVAVEIM